MVSYVVCFKDLQHASVLLIPVRSVWNEGMCYDWSKSAHRPDTVLAAMSV